MTGHLQADDLELYALGATEGDERKQVEAHLSSCADCRLLLAQARGRVAAVMMAAPPRTAPAGARESLFARIESESGGRRQTSTHAWLPWLLVAAGLILAVVLGITVRSNFRLRRQVRKLQQALDRTRQSAAQAESVVDLIRSPETLRVELLAAHGTPAPLGRIFFNRRRGMLFYAANLPPVPPSKTYQLWLVPKAGSPISLGICRPDAKGNAELLSVAKVTPTAPTAFALTVEPAGGVPQPTGPKLLVGLVR